MAAGCEIIAEHARSFERGRLIRNPRRCLPIPEKKPGALRHGAPFQNRELPEAAGKVRLQPLLQKGGGRAFAELPIPARDAGMEPLEAACAPALENGVIQGSVIQNEMRRRSEPERPKALGCSHGRALAAEPQADYRRYDAMQGESSHVR